MTLPDALPIACMSWSDLVSEPTFVILTGEANGVMRSVHDRQPNPDSILDCHVCRESDIMR